MKARFVFNQLISKRLVYFRNTVDLKKKKTRAINMFCTKIAVETES